MKLTILIMLLCAFASWLYVAHTFPVPMLPRLVIGFTYGFTFGNILRDVVEQWRRA